MLDTWTRIRCTLREEGLLEMRYEGKAMVDHTSQTLDRGCPCGL